MEDLNIHLEKLLKHCALHNETMEETYESATIKLAAILFGSNQPKPETPQQIKKKTKRLSIIADDDTEGDSTRNESKISEEVNTTTSTRPPRAAKANLDLKEKSLKVKYRKDTNNEIVNGSKCVIKQENFENSKIAQKKKKKKSKEQIEPMETDTISNDECQQPTKIADESSVIVLSNVEELVTEIPDSENEAEIMPPPPVPVAKKFLRVTRKSSRENPELIDSILTTATKIKVEKESLNLTNKSDRKNSKAEQKECESKSVQEKNPIKKKGKKPIPKPIKLERKSSLQKEDENELIKETSTSPTSNRPSTRNATAALVNNNSLESVYEDAIPGPLKQSNTIEKLADVANTITSPTNNLHELLANEEIPQIPELMNVVNDIVDNEKKSPCKLDSSFKNLQITEPVTTDAITDATFVSQPLFSGNHQETFVMPDNPNLTVNINNETQVIIKPDIADATFDYNRPEKVPVPENVPAAENVPLPENLLTDDDSDYEMPLAKTAPKLKSQLNRKELFNPCVQSPLKKKIEAFEKQALYSVNNFSPVPQRQTRTKTRAKISNENTEPKMQEKPQKEIKHITPLIGSKIGKLLTPIQYNNITPTIGVIPKKISNSTSKIMGIQRPMKLQKSSLTSSTTSSSTNSRTPSQSRENSAEDFKRGYNKLHELAEERKKRREQKQLQVQQAREIKEKERSDRLLKIMEQREEKAQRKAKEAEQKHQLDEIHRQLKIQEEKREHQKKLEKQKQIDRELMEIAKKEREMFENLKIQKAKEQMHLKLQQNEKQMLQKLLIKENKRKHEFEMLNSDDSTDEEGKISQKRPPIPSWAKPSVRCLLLERQSYVSTKVVDPFFSVKPMTPDLKEIFPNIDAKYLKRNSSFIWKTPTRYSQMPKY